MNNALAGEVGLSREKKANEPIKVTDKRLFTADGDIREEFKSTVNPDAPPAERPAPAPEPKKAQPERSPEPPPQQKQHTVRDRAENPGTPFSNFIETLILQAYMSMGMLRNPYGQGAVDLGAARQMIDIIALLGEKTAGNLTEDEEGFLQAHLGELKLAYVQRSKAL